MRWIAAGVETRKNQKRIIGLNDEHYSGFRIAIPKGIYPSRPDPKEGRPGIEDRQGTPILKPL